MTAKPALSAICAIAFLSASYGLAAAQSAPPKAPTATPAKSTTPPLGDFSKKKGDTLPASKLPALPKKTLQNQNRASGGVRVAVGDVNNDGVTDIRTRKPTVLKKR